MAGYEVWCRCGVTGRSVAPQAHAAGDAVRWIWLLAAEHTGQMALGTAIAVAFARSPMQLAYTAHDLQAYSDGRFILGLCG